MKTRIFITTVLALMLNNFALAAPVTQPLLEAGKVYSFDYITKLGDLRTYQAVKISSIYNSKKGVQLAKGRDMTAGFGQFIIANISNVKVISPEIADKIIADIKAEKKAKLAAEKLTDKRTEFVSEKMDVVEKSLNRKLTETERKQLISNANKEFEQIQADKEAKKLAKKLAKK
jgi:hypothetical protein